MIIGVLSYIYRKFNKYRQWCQMIIQYYYVFCLYIYYWLFCHVVFLFYVSGSLNFFRGDIYDE